MLNFVMFVCSLRKINALSILFLDFDEFRIIPSVATGVRYILGIRSTNYRNFKFRTIFYTTLSIYSGCEISDQKVTSTRFARSSRVLSTLDTQIFVKFRSNFKHLQFTLAHFSVISNLENFWTPCLIFLESLIKVEIVQKSKVFLRGHIWCVYGSFGPVLCKFICMPTFAEKKLCFAK